MALDTVPWSSLRKAADQLWVNKNKQFTVNKKHQKAVARCVCTRSIWRIENSQPVVYCHQHRDGSNLTKQLCDNRAFLLLRSCEETLTDVVRNPFGCGSMQLQALITLLSWSRSNRKINVFFLYHYFNWHLLFSVFHSTWDYKLNYKHLWYWS